MALASFQTNNIIINRERERESYLSQLQLYREIVLERKRKRRKVKKMDGYVKAGQPPRELKEPTAKEKSSKKVVARARSDFKHDVTYL